MSGDKDYLFENFKVNLLDAESCILDCNKGEKLIIEMNNHICLGEYELARTFFKQIIEVIPSYIKYFYNIIFLRGIPDKWLLSNQIRTSANYIWILFQDYKNELSLIPKCPKIEFSGQFLKSNEFDLLITTAYYNSYENLDNFEMNLEFLKDLRQTYNFFACISSKTNFFLPKLLILSPDRHKKQLYNKYLCIDECLYEVVETSLFDFSRQKYFMENLKNFILTQPILSKQVIDKILSNSTKELEMREDFNKIQEIFHIIYVDLIMLFIHSKDYEKVYDYLKFIPFNGKILMCRSYVQLLFSVIVVLTHCNEIKNPIDVLIFTGFCANRLKIDHKNNHIAGFKKLSYFTNQLSEYMKIKEINPNKDHEKWLLKHKIYESVLANSNEDLLSNLHIVEDLLIVYQTENSDKIPIFFLNYTKNLEKQKGIFNNLSYEELMSLILSFSKFRDVDNSNEFLWKKAITNTFWNEYLNFLRVYEEHCLGYVLRQSIKYVEVGKFDNAVMLLHPLNNLKLLLILFVWDKFENDINSRKEILDLFWSSYLKYREPDSRSYTLVPFFEDIIINLDYVINFSMWIQEKLKKYDSNKLYSDLLTHSIPFVMKNYLIDFDFKELLNYFIQRFPMSNKKLQKDHFHSTMIIVSFYFYHLILKKIEDHFTNSFENLDNQLFTEKEKEEMLGILQKIILFPYRLNIMGDIFNLIFIKIKYFYDNREKDNIIENNQQQPSHSNSQFLYHKKIFIEIVKFLKLVMQPLEKFNYSNLNSMFEEDYLDSDIYNMIKSVADKEIFLEDLKNIDTDYLAALRSNHNLSYKDFLIIKSNFLKFNVDELIFRFNIVDNPWLEIIYENNENNSFLSTILQNSKHYFQVAKKFQMWEIAEEIIQFFKLPESHQNEIHLMKYFTDLKNKLYSWKEDSNFTVESLVDFNFLNKLLVKDYYIRHNITDIRFEVSQEDLNFEYFKILFDLSLTENISTYKSTVFMDKAISYLENSREKGNSIFHNIIDRYKVFIDPNLSKDQKGECLSQMVVSTKNLGAVDITSLKNHLKILTNQQQALQNLIEKVNQPKAIELSHEDLNKYFVEAFQTIIDSEEYYYKNMESSDQITHKTHNQTNYLKIFLNYLINIGDIYYLARINYKKKGSNYLRLLKKYPKEIIAKLFLKYNSESEALKIAKMTKTDLISVILEFTNYYKKSIIHYTEFNNYFNEILNALESSTENKQTNFETLCEKEEWVKGSQKTFPLSMRILEFVYKLSYDKNESQEEYNQFVPLFVSLYRIEFDSLSDSEQIKFWTLLIEKYSNVKIFNNYIKMIFTKFYFYRTFYQKNHAFKHLYDLIYNHNKTDSFTSNGLGSNTNSSESSSSLKEKYEMYKKMHEKVVIKKELTSMLPKTFSYIPTSNEYINKLSTKMGRYLEDKLEKKTNNYSKYLKDMKNIKYPSFSKNDKDEDDLNIKFTDIQNLSYKKNINFYENLCRGLLSQKQFDLALEIADNYLDETKSDVIQILINEIVSNTDEEEKLFKLLIRMKDKNKVFQYTKKYWYHWKPETTITILRLIKDEFECGEMQAEIKNMIKKLKVFYAIIKKDILPHMTLKKLEEDCVQNIEKILEELMLKNLHDLGYKLLRVYNKFDQYKNTVKFSEIKLLLSTNDIQNKILALEKLTEVNENKISFCTLLIKELNNYQNKLLIIKYLLKNYDEELDEALRNILVNQKIAIKVFFLIPKELQEKLVHLINYPELIIETLLVNMRFDIIRDIFHYFPKLQNDSLITFYAEKAMSFGKVYKIDENYVVSNEKININYDLVILTTENQKDIRQNHYFKTAPDFELFIKFMDICRNIKIIAKVCFEVSNSCSRYLLEKNPTQPKLLFINFISKVLHYLECRLELYEINEEDYEQMIEIKAKLDIYEKLVELFKEFIYHGIDDLIDLELDKFYKEDQYKEMVRDKLIDNDYLNLAVKYCNELNIDSKRIDLKLGLFSLKNRNFSAARKGFEKILLSNSLRKSSQITNIHKGLSSNLVNLNNLSCEEHDDVVNQIINILQGSFNLKIDELEKIHRYLIFRLSCCIIPNEESTLKILDRYRDLSVRKLSSKRRGSAESSLNLQSGISGGNQINPIKLNKYIDIILLDEYLKNERNVIVNETLYYIKTYGTTTQLLNFYIDNDLLDDTVNYLINNRIPLDVFKEEVVKKCYEKRKMMYSLCLSLRKVYQSNKYAKDLIEEVIIFLKVQEAHEELIEVYMMMNDYLKASLEAINIIKKTTDVDVKMQYYQKAALNLSEYLNSNTGNIINIYEGSDDLMNKRCSKKVERTTLQAVLKLLTLQIEILNIKKDIQYTLITDDEEERYKIVQEIITLNDILSLAIIKEYNLRLADVFMRSTIDFISKKNFNGFETLLQIIKKWNSHGIISQFSENYYELWDNILLQAISLISLEDDNSILYAKENIIPRFYNDESRMYSLYIIGELENSVILAYQLKNSELVKEIKSRAEAENNKELLDLINNMNS